MFNLLKQYNALLELDDLTVPQRIKSLRGVFDRDIPNNPNFSFRMKKIYPIPADGANKVDLLFSHLTTKVVDPKTQHREYDRSRSVRLHWLRYHIEEHKQTEMLIFSTQKGRERRTYVYDKVEKYVIVLEPKEETKLDEQGKEYAYKYYYLLTAFRLEGKDLHRNKIEKLYTKRHEELL